MKCKDWSREEGEDEEAEREIDRQSNGEHQENGSLQ